MIAAGITRPERLHAFMERAAGEVVWGVNDCTAAPVTWLAGEIGKALPLPSYTSREEALAIIAKHGTLADTWSAFADKYGVAERYGEPEFGDIGVIDTRLYGQIGGIITTSRVMLLRRDDGNWHALGPVRRFVKVFAVD